MRFGACSGRIDAGLDSLEFGATVDAKGTEF